MRLCVLGSGTAIPHPERGASGYALIAEDNSVCLLECGPGSTRRWPSAGVTFDRVSAVVVTHHHVDHVSDLPALLFGRRVANEQPPLTLVGPVGHRTYLKNLRAAYEPWLGDPGDRVQVRELADGEQWRSGAFQVRAREVQHAEGALGYRVQADGRTLAFSGDSGPCDALVELCRGVHVALLECSYPETRETSSHLNARTAAQVAIAAGVRRLVLTHFYPACDGVDLAAQVRAAGYSGALHLARDGDEVQI